MADQNLGLPKKKLEDILRELVIPCDLNPRHQSVPFYCPCSCHKPIGAGGGLGDCIHCRLLRG